MRQKEKEQLQAVLDKMDRNENKCLEQVSFLNEHGFKFEKQAADMKASVYRECFRDLNSTLSRMKVDEWTVQDEAIANEIIAYFRDGTVKLQHDLNLYAGWMEKWKGTKE